MFSSNFDYQTIKFNSLAKDETKWSSHTIVNNIGRVIQKISFYHRCLPLVLSKQGNISLSICIVIAKCSFCLKYSRL